MKKWVSFVLVGLMMVTTITGCSSNDYPDALELLKEAQKKMQDVESMEMDFEMELDVTMSTKDGDETKIPMKMNMKGSTSITTKPVASYAKMETSGSVMGQDMDQETESYSVLEGEDMVTYSLEEGEWYKSASAADAITDLMKQFYSEESTDMLKKLDLEVVDTEKVGKKDTYVLEMTISNKTFKSLIDEEDATASMQLKMIESFLGDDFALTVSAYIDQDTKEFVKISADFTQVIEKIFPLIMGMTAEMPDVTMTAKKCEINATFANFNKVKEIKVPQKVKDSAVDMDSYLEDYDYDLDDDYDYDYGDEVTE